MPADNVDFTSSVNLKKAFKMCSEYDFLKLSQENKMDSKP